MFLTLRPLTIGPPVYAHLADYEVMEDGRSIGSIKQEREEEPRNPERAWSWSLTIVGARLAGIKTSGYGPSLEDVKARLCRSPGRLSHLARHGPAREATEVTDSDSGPNLLPQSRRFQSA
jgi:hypothetical protein